MNSLLIGVAAVVIGNVIGNLVISNIRGAVVLMGAVVITEVHLGSVVEVVVLDAMVRSVFKVMVKFIILMLHVVLQGLAAMEVDVVTVGVTLVRRV